MSKFTGAVVRVVTVNWKLKILALIVAFLSFLAIRGAIGFEVYYDAPVVVSVEPGVAILDQNPRTVQVMFRGSREDLRRIEQQRIKAVIKVNASSPDGSERVTIRTADIHHGSSARVVLVRPDVVRLTFDHEIEKVVPVARPALIGSPLVGKAELSYSPTVAQIWGPKRRVNETVILATEPVDVTGAVESFSRKVRILSPGDAWVARIEPKEVTAEVSVTVRTSSKLLESIPVAAVVPQGIGARVFIEPDRVNVRTSGSDKVVDSLRPSDVIAYVDCSGLSEPADQERPVQVRLRSGSELSISIEPPTVVVRYETLTIASAETEPETEEARPELPDENVDALVNGTEHNGGLPPPEPEPEQEPKPEPEDEPAQAD